MTWRWILSQDNLVIEISLHLKGWLSLAEELVHFHGVPSSLVRNGDPAFKSKF